MAQYLLSLIETSSIQGFIFGSNNLRENIGASELVRLATAGWAVATLGQVTPRHNVDPDTEKFLVGQRIEAGQLDAEVIFMGGGGMAVLFAGDDPDTLAKDFVYRLSRQVVLSAPGLGITATHIPVDFDGDSLYDKKLEAQVLIQQAAHPGSVPVLGLGVTVADTSTGWPTIDFTSGAVREPASAQRLAKMEAADDATRRLRNSLAQVHQAGYRFTDNLDELGGKPGEESYIAVVHIDGNGMAERRQQIEKEFVGKKGSATNRAYIEVTRTFSEKLKEAGNQALQKMIGEVLPYAPPASDRPVFPVRPIVYGGDDTTWVCDGPLGLELAVLYLQAFEQQQLSDGRPGYASAGVAIVKKHYPFSRAYQLSEELRGAARDRVKAVLNSKYGSAIDWHITAGGLLGDLESIREREYRVDKDELTMRPLLVGLDDQDHRDWGAFLKVWSEFNQREWRQSRNKRAALRDVLRQGENAVEQFRHAYGKNGQPLELPQVGKPSVGANGWIPQKGESPKRCLHFDALEALDQIELEVGL